MDAILLLVEAIGIFLVIRWVAGGDGASSLLGWKPPATPPPPPRIGAVRGRLPRGAGRR